MKYIYTPIVVEISTEAGFFPGRLCWHFCHLTHYQSMHSRLIFYVHVFFYYFIIHDIQVKIILNQTLQYKSSIVCIFCLHAQFIHIYICVHIFVLEGPYLYICVHVICVPLKMRCFGFFDLQCSQYYCAAGTGMYVCCLFVCLFVSVVEIVRMCCCTRSCLSYPVCGYIARQFFCCVSCEVFV